MRPVDVILRIEAVPVFAAGVALYLQLNGHPLWLLPRDTHLGRIRR